MDCKCRLCQMIEQHAADRSEKISDSPVGNCNSPKAGTGEKYYCRELDCPVHGQRNQMMFGKGAGDELD